MRLICTALPSRGVHDLIFPLLLIYNHRSSALKAVNDALARADQLIKGIVGLLERLTYRIGRLFIDGA